jgi:hypothetical protein
MQIADVLSELDKARPVLALLPPPAGPLAIAGLELAELIAGFVPEEQHQQTIETLREFIRAGAHGTVQAYLDERFPNG